MDNEKLKEMFEYIERLATKRSNNIITVAFEKSDIARTYARVMSAIISGKCRNFNPTSLTWKFENDSVIEFKVFKDEMDCRGQKRNYLFIVADKIDKRVAYQLFVRTELCCEVISLNGGTTLFF